MEKDELMNVIENLMYEYMDRFDDNNKDPFFDGVAVGLKIALKEIDKLEE